MEKKFTVRRTEFHGGGDISCHNSLKQALSVSRQHKTAGCICGCTQIICNTEAARKELRAFEIEACGYSEL